MVQINSIHSVINDDDKEKIVFFTQLQIQEFIRIESSYAHSLVYNGGKKIRMSHYIDIIDI